MSIKDDIEEARLLGGQIVLSWSCPRNMQRSLMSVQEYHEMRRDFDNAISMAEQEFPPEDFRHQLVTAMRKRWFP